MPAPFPSACYRWVCYRRRRDARPRMRPRSRASSRRWNATASPTFCRPSPTAGSPIRTCAITPMPSKARLKEVIDTPADVFLAVFRIYAATEMAAWLHQISRALPGPDRRIGRRVQSPPQPLHHRHPAECRTGRPARLQTCDLEGNRGSGRRPRASLHPRIGLTHDCESNRLVPCERVIPLTMPSPLGARERAAHRSSPLPLAGEGGTRREAAGG